MTSRSEGSSTQDAATEAEWETRVEFGHMTAEFGWIPEWKGIKYASHARTVHFRNDPPTWIDHWSDPTRRIITDRPVTGLAPDGTNRLERNAASPPGVYGSDLEPSASPTGEKP